MYVQITTRCNFACQHCMFSCRPGRGTDMPMDTVRAAFRLCEDSGRPPFLGGGEPTLHPRFWEILGLALGAAAGNDCDSRVGVITNGSRRDAAVKLANLAREGVIYAGLSRDHFHSRYPISEAVVRAFTKTSAAGYATNGGDNDMRDLRDRALTRVHRVGRAARTGVWTVADRGCDSCGPVVTPDGAIWRCNCRKERLGDVFTGYYGWVGDVDGDDLEACTTSSGRLKREQKDGTE